MFGWEMRGQKISSIINFCQWYIESTINLQKGTWNSEIFNSWQKDQTYNFVNIFREIVEQTVEQMFVDIKWGGKWAQCSTSGLDTQIEDITGNNSWSSESLFIPASAMMSPMSISSINIATAARLPADAPETSTLIMKTLIYTLLSLQLEICDGNSYVVHCINTNLELSLLLKIYFWCKNIWSIGLNTADDPQMVEAKKPAASEW